MEVTDKTLVGDLIKHHPDAVPVLLRHGMQCVGCHVATWETLGEAANTHSINIDILLKDINKTIEVV